MATDKNARVEQDNWSQLRPGCHPSGTWVIHTSIAVGVYSVSCSECNRKHFQFMLQARQW